MSSLPNYRPGDSTAPDGSVLPLKRHRPEIPTVGEIIEKFLNHKERAVEREQIAPRSLADYQMYLGWFKTSLGNRPIDSCSGIDLTLWLDERTGWKSANTVKGALARIQACFNWWARLSDTKNPFKHVTHSWGAPRRPLSQSDFDKFFKAITCRRFAQMFLAIRLTGCRPDELYRMRKEEIYLDVPAPCIVQDKSKTSKRTGRNRRIPLSTEAVALFRDVLAVANGSEFVFVTRRGTIYNKDSFGHECRRVCARAGIKGVTPYRLRHSVALAAKSAGTDTKTIADFLGTSVQMLTRYYLSYSGELHEDLTKMAETVAKSKLPDIPRR